MSDSLDERGAELRELFFETSQELLQALNEESLKLEKNPGDEEIVRSIRRTVHTLKGDSAACGLRELSELAHHFEDALSLETAAAHGALAEIAFAAADVFAAMLAAYHGAGAMPATDALLKRINELTTAPAAKRVRRKKKADEVAAKSGKDSDKNKDWTDSEKRAMAVAQAAGLALYDVAVKIDPHCTMPIAGRQLIQNAISGVGQVIVVRPNAKSPAATKQVEFVIGSSHSEEQIAAKARVPTIAGDVSVILIAAGQPAKAPRKIEDGQSLPSAIETTASDVSVVKQTSDEQTAVAAIQAPSAAPDLQTPTPETLAPSMAENILRVDAGRIDNVLNLVGELIIGKSMLQQALNEFSRRYPKEPVRGKFADAMAFQARVLNDLQRSVMKIRMVPVDQLFRRFPRMVRDVARQCGREVDLELSGQETDLDKGILDAIAEPLTHLVRNAVSHGIETRRGTTQPGQIAAGKNSAECVSPGQSSSG